MNCILIKRDRIIKGKGSQIETIMNKPVISDKINKKKTLAKMFKEEEPELKAKKVKVNAGEDKKVLHLFDNIMEGNKMKGSEIALELDKRNLDEIAVEIVEREDKKEVKKVPLNANKSHKYRKNPNVAKMLVRGKTKI